jgi:hypothetical protein
MKFNWTGEGEREKEMETFFLNILSHIISAGFGLFVLFG